MSDFTFISYVLGLCILKSTTILTIPSKEESSLSVEVSETFGYVQSLDYAEKMISKFETKNAVKFFCYRADKDFGNHGIYY